MKLSEIKCKHCGLVPKFKDIKYEVTKDDVIYNVECQCACGEHFKKEHEYDFLDILLTYIDVLKHPRLLKYFTEEVLEEEFIEN